MSTLAIRCPSCGSAIQGDTAEELIDGALLHLEQEHPELIGRYTDDELLDWPHGEGTS